MGDHEEIIIIIFLKQKKGFAVVKKEYVDKINEVKLVLGRQNCE